MLFAMHIIGKSSKFSFVLVLLQILAAWTPARAAEEQAPEIAYFRLVVATCYTCHSATGAGADAIPPLQGLSEAHMKELLTAYKTGREQATIMNRISKALTDAEIDRISAMLGRRDR